MKKNIAFCLNDKYVDFCYVTMFSIITNKNPSDKLIFHLLTDYLSAENQKKITKLVNNSKDEVKIYIVDKKRFDGFNMNWSVYVWFRILIPEVVDDNVSRVLYLDCDTIVQSNLDYLFNLDFTNKAIAAVIDKESFNNYTFERLNYNKDKQYICSGVLLINVNYWRNNKISEKIYDFGKKYSEKLIFPDQDAINYICKDSKIMLPLKFGVINNFLSAASKYCYYDVIETINNPEIIHYAGNSPWKYYSNHHFYKKLWWRYKKQSKLGANNINIGYLNSMIIHYIKMIKFIFTHFKPYPHIKPATIKKQDVLASIK